MLSQKGAIPMLTRVALARSYNDAFPVLRAAYAIPLHTAEEAEREGEKRWQLLVWEIPLKTFRGLLESAGTGGQVTAEAPCRYAEFQFTSPRGYLLSFSPGARYLAASFGGSRLVVWDLCSRRTLPPLELPGIEDYAFAPTCSQGKAVLQLLIAAAAGLFIATFVEPTQDERYHGGYRGAWEVTSKASPLPLLHVALHAATGHVALLAHSEPWLSIWALSTLVSPETAHLGGDENTPSGPLCLHPRVTEQPLFTWHFTPDGRLLLLHGGGVLTLHDAHRPGVVQSLALPEQHVYPECPLATSIDGLRLATRGKHGLILWERDTIRDPFRPPRHTAEDEGVFDKTDALEFSHDGLPIVLTLLGELIWYDWKQGAQRKRIALGTIPEPCHPPKRARRGARGENEQQT
jgi:hypothetical protein